MPDIMSIITLFSAFMGLYVIVRLIIGPSNLSSASSRSPVPKNSS